MLVRTNQAITVIRPRASETKNYQVFRGVKTISGGWIYTEGHLSYELQIPLETTILGAKILYNVKPDNVPFSDQFAISVNGSWVAIEDWSIPAAADPRSKQIDISLLQGATNYIILKWSYTCIIPFINTVNFTTDVQLIIEFEGEAPKPPVNFGDLFTYALIIGGVGIGAVALFKGVQYFRGKKG